jgi:alkaline phosphatase D
MMAQVDYDGGPGVSVNHDQWDGYAVSRNRFLSFIDQARPANPVVLTGDWHSARVNDLRLDFSRPETPVLATELVGTSLSSGCGWAAAVKAALPNNPHVKYLNPDRRGYTRATATPATLRADYRVVPSAADTSGTTTDSSWVVEDGRPGAVPA